MRQTYGSLKVATAICRAVLLMVLAATAVSQTSKNPFGPVPKAQQPALQQRLKAYTAAFRKKDWAGLYDLVSDKNKYGSNHKLKVTRRVFVSDMEGTDGFARLIRFVPARTDVVSAGIFNVYGCGELPYGEEKVERIAAVRAVWEHGDWFFSSWDYPDPPEPCSNLANPAWKPARYMDRLDQPMLQVSCDLFLCTL